MLFGFSFNLETETQKNFFYRLSQPSGNAPKTAKIFDQVIKNLLKALYMK